VVKKGNSMRVQKQEVRQSSRPFHLSKTEIAIWALCMLLIVAAYFYIRLAGSIEVSQINYSNSQLMFRVKNSQPFSRSCTATVMSSGDQGSVETKRILGTIKAREEIYSSGPLELPPGDQKISVAVLCT